MNNSYKYSLKWKSNRENLREKFFLKTPCLPCFKSKCYFYYYNNESTAILIIVIWTGHLICLIQLTVGPPVSVTPESNSAYRYFKCNVIYLHG